MRTRPTGPLTAALLALALAACGTAEQAERELTGEVEALLESYLPLLGEAYATGDLAPLEPYVAMKEIASIAKRMEDLQLQGRTLRPTFRELTVESIQNWSHSNAYVTTVETWDLEVYSTGSQQLLTEEPGQTNRVKYQLKRDGDRWIVLFRTIVE